MIAPGTQVEYFDEALRTGGFDWIVLTSQNAVDLLAQRAAAIGLDRQTLTAPRYAAVGSATVAAFGPEWSCHWGPADSGS